jgi:hypothetical protein
MRGVRVCARAFENSTSARPSSGVWVLLREGEFTFWGLKWSAIWHALEVMLWSKCGMGAIWSVAKAQSVLDICCADKCSDTRSAWL